MSHNEIKPFFADDLEAFGFTGRKAGLARVPRYQSRKVMIYRTSDLTHSEDVVIMAWDMLKPLQAAFDGRVDYSRLFALLATHDDPEQITGDKPLCDKRRFTRSEREAYDLWTRAAIEKLALANPSSLAGHDYRSLLLEAHEKRSIESRILSFIDKKAALFEALHEVRGGNCSFHVTAFEYLAFTDQIPSLYPELEKLVGTHPLASRIEPAQVLTFAMEPRLHSLRNMLEPTGLEPYDHWKRLMLTRSGIGRLVDRHESAYLLSEPAT